MKRRKTKLNSLKNSLAVTRIIKNARARKTVLTMTAMGLTEIPNVIANCKHLTMLNLMGNKIKSIPNEVYILINLRSMFLSNNEITELNADIAKLKELRSLYLSLNMIETIPNTIGSLTNLESLSISFNNIKFLPETLFEINALKELYVASNQLNTIPESIGGLASLETLDLSDNKLTSLPASLKEITSLKTLFLHGNEALGIPVELLGPTSGQVREENMIPTKASEILDYYFRTRADQSPLNEAKLILVGRGAVGKTSIVNRLIHSNFDISEKKTDGINITQWTIQLNNNEDVRLNIWDFGGQEIMHATHQFFLTQRSLYLLVLNGREGGEDADAEYWLKLIESFGGESPVIVVLNKIKDHPFDLNRRGLQAKYPCIRAFIKTDCEDGYGISDLRKAIEYETDRLDHLRDPFPSSWFTIKGRLSNTDVNYLSFDKYRKICEGCGETVQSAQEALATYLHALGIALNYKDDPRLQDTHVLNPHWVTNGIYKILNAEKLEAQKGEIRLDDLSEILSPEEYPQSMRFFLLDLMKKFELCFGFSDDNTHFLIPELLDKQEPQEATGFNPQDCLNFQYHYTILPEGLLPRLIVRSHSLSNGLARWRTGVILNFEGNRALVKADVHDRKVFISVAGPLAGRRRLLAVIRSDFERIHRDIHNLQPQEMVPIPGAPNVVIPYQDLIVYENNNTKKFTNIIDGKVIELDVNSLLNGVDIEGTRRKEKQMARDLPRVRVFYSYSHKDEQLRNELETHLKLLQRQGKIESWHDRQIGAGDEWRDRINENLEKADIILLLVSADFIASDYCYEKEMSKAIERHNNNEAIVIPIILRDVNWHSAPFSKFQALPKDGSAVTLWDNKDTAWRDVATGIEKAVIEIHQRSGKFIS